MNAVDYIKSRRFGLVFLYYSEGIPIKDLTSIFTNHKGESNLISARGSHMPYQDNWFSSSILLDNPVMGEGGYIEGEVDPMVMYSWMRCASINNLKKLIRENHSKWKEIKKKFKSIDAQHCHCLLALLDLTNAEDESDQDLDHINFCKMKTGGVELIYEYLFSKFIHEWEFETSSDLNPFIERSFEPDYGDDKFLEVRADLGGGDASKCTPIFKLEQFKNLSHLTKYRYVPVWSDYDDDDLRSEREDGSYVYFNFDLKYLKRVDLEFCIPKRIKEILSQDQISHLEENCSTVLENHLVYIFAKILRQTIPSERWRLIRF